MCNSWNVDIRSIKSNTKISLVPVRFTTNVFPGSIPNRPQTFEKLYRVGAAQAGHDVIVGNRFLKRRISINRSWINSCLA
jgi:hypothetical protein